VEAQDTLKKQKAGKRKRVTILLVIVSPPCAGCGESHTVPPIGLIVAMFGEQVVKKM